MKRRQRPQLDSVTHKPSNFVCNAQKQHRYLQKSKSKHRFSVFLFNHGFPDCQKVKARLFKTLAKMCSSQCATRHSAIMSHYQEHPNLEAQVHCTAQPLLLKAKFCGGPKNRPPILAWKILLEAFTGLKNVDPTENVHQLSTPAALQHFEATRSVYRRPPFAKPIFSWELGQRHLPFWENPKTYGKSQFSGKSSTKWMILCTNI